MEEVIRNYFQCWLDKDIDVVKGIDNVFLASQWLMGPGGLPTAAAMGKFAAWRIMNGKNK